MNPRQGGSGSLEAELEGALADAAAGEPPGVALGKRLERVAREILLRRGLGAARVEVHSARAETSVQIHLPPVRSVVQTLRIAVDRG